MTKSREEIQAFFLNQLAKVIEPHEAERQQTLMMVLACHSAIAFLTLIIVFLVGIQLAFHICFAAIFLGSLIHWFLTKNYISKYKQDVIREVVRFVNPDLSYFPQQAVSQETFDESGLFRQNCNRYSGGDLIRGKYLEVDVAFSDLNVRHQTGSGKNRTVQQVFQGLFFLANFNKAFDGRVYVMPDTTQGLGVLGDWLQSINLTKGELVKLEDPQFEKYFVVYASDQIKARYVLSTSMMARLVNYRLKTKQPIHVAFVDGKIFVAVNFAQNYLEPALFKSLMSVESIEQYVSQIDLMLDIINELKLNVKIWG